MPFVTSLLVRACRAIIGRGLGEGNEPASVDVAVKPFPWPAVTFDAGAVAAAAAFNLLLVFAFLTPTRVAVATVVREKELRLREGMRILGLKASRPGRCPQHFVVQNLGCCLDGGCYGRCPSQHLRIVAVLWACLSMLRQKSRVNGLQQ
jgi:hypothetical protein